MKPDVVRVILIAIILVFILELAAMAKGWNGQCLRASVAAIATMCGFLGGWGLKRMRKTDNSED